MSPICRSSVSLFDSFPVLHLGLIVYVRICIARKCTTGVGEPPRPPPARRRGEARVTTFQVIMVAHSLLLLRRSLRGGSGVYAVGIVQLAMPRVEWPRLKPGSSGRTGKSSPVALAWAFALPPA